MGEVLPSQRVAQGNRVQLPWVTGEMAEDRRSGPPATAGGGQEHSTCSAQDAHRKRPWDCSVHRAQVEKPRGG